MENIKKKEGDNYSKTCAGVVLVVIIIGSILVYFAFSDESLFSEFKSQEHDYSDLERFEPSETDRADHNRNSTPINAVSWSPDGSFLAAASELEGFIIWETGTWTKVYENDREFLWPTSFDWSSDGKYLALGSKLGVCIYSTENWEPKINLLYKFEIIKDLEFSPDDSKLATAVFEDTIHIWDCKDWKLLEQFKAHDDSIRNIAWSPDSSMLASASWDETVKIWDTSTWELKHEITIHTDWVGGISWSPDGTRLATGSWDDTVVIWDTSTWTVIQTIHDEYSQNDLVRWNYDGSYIATNQLENIYIYKSGSWSLVNTLSEHKYGAESFDWAPGTNRCVSGSFKNQIKIWDLNEVTNEFELEIEFELEFEP
jgi:WD40 repeat protein